MLAETIKQVETDKLTYENKLNITINLLAIMNIFWKSASL